VSTKIKVGMVAENMNMSDHYVALDGGYYADEGLDVELVGHFWGSLAPLDSGEMLISSNTPKILEAMLLDGEPYKFVLITRREAPHYIISRPEVKTAADLKGKTVWGAGEGAVNYYMTLEWLRENGLEPHKDVRLISFSERDERFFEGPTPAWANTSARYSADAIMTGPPESLWLTETAGYHLLADLCELYPDKMIHGLAAHEDVLARQPDLIRKVVRAHVRAAKTIQEDRLTTTTVWRKRWGLNQAVADRLWELYRWRFIAETDPKWLGPCLDYTRRQLERRYPDREIGSPDPATLLDASFLPVAA